MKWANVIKLAGTRKKGALIGIVMFPIMINLITALLRYTTLFAPLASSKPPLNHILKYIGEFSWMYKASLIGCLVYLLSAAITHFTAPKLISEHVDCDSYKTWCISNSNTINPLSFFKNIFSLDDNKIAELTGYNSFYFPFSKIIGVVSAEQYCSVYSVMEYDFHNRSNPILRWIVSITAFFSIFAMYLPLVRRIFNAFIGG